jgi:riboflavin synthase
MGTVLSIARSGGGARIEVGTSLAAELSPGDSVLVNGVCLTATASSKDVFGADLAPETLRRSTLGNLAGGDGVNLELALRAADRLGGHIVQGHVDAVAEVRSASPEGEVWLDVPQELMRYVVEKGSVTLDGVSLTVAGIDDEGLGVALIPETLARTTLKVAKPGRRVNLEVDVLAKYVEKMLAPYAEDGR